MSRLGALVAAGRTSDVYEFGPGTVIKVPRSDVPDHWAVLEAEFTAAVRTLNVPAPALVDVTLINGRHAIVFQRVDGRSMWEMMIESPDQTEPLGRTLAETHSSILSAGPPIGLEGFVDRVQRKLVDAERLDSDELRAAHELSDQLPRGAALLHGDLHPGNVLMTTDGPIVIDWFDAAIGHPVGDVVRSSLLMRQMPGRASPSHLPGSRPAMLTALHRSYVWAMADVLLPQASRLQDWEALIAASRLSEGVRSDVPTLLELWRKRGDDWSSPLSVDLTAAGG